jgi:hypothetical protein
MLDRCGYAFAARWLSDLSRGKRVTDPISTSFIFGPRPSAKRAVLRDDVEFIIQARVSNNPPRPLSPIGVYWTAFIGLFFDYYDLYLFVYLEKVLAAHFGLSTVGSNALQFSGLAGVGLGALIFGHLADRFGRERMLFVVFGVYVVALSGLSLAWNFESLLGFRVLASLALGAEWGISHALMNERVGKALRYRFAALLQFAILGGLLAALANRYVLPVVGWRWLFAASIFPVVGLSMLRWRWFAETDRKSNAMDGFQKAGGLSEATPSGLPASASIRQSAEGNPHARRLLLTTAEGLAFARCLGLASLTIASGTLNVFFVKELPQSTLYTILFWVNAAPGMLLGSAIVRRMGVRRALLGYASVLVALSLLAWREILPGGKLAFALILPLLNGIPFGLMGAYFNEVFARHRTMLSGSAYNFGRILAGFSPLLITQLGLHQGGNYFLFSAALGLGVLAIGWGIADERA